MLKAITVGLMALFGCEQAKPEPVKTMLLEPAPIAHCINDCFDEKLKMAKAPFSGPALEIIERVCRESFTNNCCWYEKFVGGVRKKAYFTLCKRYDKEETE